MELKLLLDLQELSENFENDYHIDKLEISIDQVLRFRSRSFAIHFEIQVGLCLLTFEQLFIVIIWVIVQWKLLPIRKWIKPRLLFHFCCNYEVLRVRFRLVARLSLLCLEYSCDEDEDRDDKNLPPTYFCELLP